jgi:hypothetical protein
VTAQGIDVAVVSARSSTSRGVGPVAGGQLVISTERTHGVALGRFGLSYLTGREQTLGSLCSGLVLSGTCAPERLQNRRRLATISAGLGRVLLQRRGFELQAYADLALGAARIDDRAIDGGGKRGASRGVVGGRAGAELGWAPGSRSPLAAHGGVAIDGIKPISGVDCLDCWQPFSNGFDLVRFYVGVSLPRESTRKK